MGAETLGPYGQSPGLLSLKNLSIAGHVEGNNGSRQVLKITLLDAWAKWSGNDLLNAMPFHPWPSKDDFISPGWRDCGKCWPRLELKF